MDKAGHKGKEMQHPQHPILKGLEGGEGGDPYTGVDLVEEMYDLVRRRLPHLTLDDPLRPTVSQWLPLLGDALGRPAVLPTTPARQRRASDLR